MGFVGGPFVFQWIVRLRSRPVDLLPIRVLFLDDDPGRAEVFLERCPQAVWVETVADCIEKLAGPWDEVHLDHDLGGEVFVDSARPDCGMEVVRWLASEPRPHLRSARFVVHTHNPEASCRMLWTLRIRGYRAEVRPFGLPPTPGEDEKRPPRWFDAIGRYFGSRGRP